MTLDTSVTKTSCSFLSIFLPFSSTCPTNASKSADSVTTTATTHIREILSLYKQLSSFSSLEPREEVNAVFGNLVELCITTLSDDAIVSKILKDPRVSAITPHLRTLCSTGECALESHWANLLLLSPASDTTINPLSLFPYYKNYLDLSRLELNALLAITPNPPSAIAFLGSGPLPLTSICLAALLHPTTPGLRILNIDHDQAAINVSSRLCATLPGPQSAVQEFKCASATDDATDLSNFDVVYVAALVGMSLAEKEVVVRSVVRKMKRDALVVLRSAHSLRGLLYPVVDVAGLERVGLKVEVVVHPWNRVVNSVIVARVVG
ncbi:hypothetical protein KC19_10G154600 [Ceratodon purpureus]|uniref:Nicotianamine synthase n=1 Tax=Ceratodon purpureus TaxID=3225 RepID=A0A8T0GPG2_CERPU|nr:hypothetical protein KC19_10G154600 [Ceratodon purpureus]